MNPNNPYNMYSTTSSNLSNVFPYTHDLSGNSQLLNNSSGYSSLNTTMNDQLAHSMAASFSNYDSPNGNNFVNLLPFQHHFQGQAFPPTVSSNLIDYKPRLKHKKAKVKKSKVKAESEESEAETETNNDDSNEVFIQSQLLTDFINKGGIQHNENDNFEEINQLPMFSLNSRILIKSDKTTVTVGEIFRRTNPPESMNTSVLSCLLRKAKTTTMGKELRQCLEQVNINLPPGRRKGVSNNAFTALTECDTLRIVQDFGSLVEKYLVPTNLCEIFPKTHSVSEAIEKIQGIKHIQDFLLPIRDMWSQGDLLAMESNIKCDKMVTERGLPVLNDFVKLSRATHRFDFPIFDVILKLLLNILRDYEVQIRNSTPEIASFLFQQHGNFQPIMPQIPNLFQENMPPTDFSLFYQQMDLINKSANSHPQQQMMKDPLQLLHSHQQLNYSSNSTISPSTESNLNDPKTERY